jgi:hypothetical protein
MANAPPKKLRWDRNILVILLLAGLGFGGYLLASRM